MESEVIKLLKSINAKLEKLNLGIERLEPLHILDEDNLTIDQAARYLNKSKNTIYGYVHNGEIGYKKSGNHLFFEKAELDRFVNTSTKERREQKLISRINKPKG